ncbi:MAG: hypothetical protein ACRDGM_04985 [bacterium]
MTLLGLLTPALVTIGLVQHELRKRILRRFKAEGIEIPFPVRTIELRSAPGPEAHR